jgi:hypothetical protein
MSSIRVIRGYIVSLEDGTNPCGHLHGDLREASLCQARTLMTLPASEFATSKTEAKWCRLVHEGVSVDLGDGCDPKIVALLPDSAEFNDRYSAMLEEYSQRSELIERVYPALVGESSFALALHLDLQQNPPYQLKSQACVIVPEAELQPKELVAPAPPATPAQKPAKKAAEATRTRQSRRQLGPAIVAA